jgi:sulfur-carrier protein
MGMVTVKLPSQMRHCFDGDLEVTLSGETVAEVLDALIESYPKSRWHIFSSEGRLHPYLYVYCNGENARFLPNGLEEQLEKGDELYLQPATDSGG